MAANRDVVEGCNARCYCVVAAKFRVWIAGPGLVWWVYGIRKRDLGQRPMIGAVATGCGHGREARPVVSCGGQPVDGGGGVMVNTAEDEDRGQQLWLIRRLGAAGDGGGHGEGEIFYDASGACIVNNCIHHV